MSQNIPEEGWYLLDDSIASLKVDDKLCYVLDKNTIAFHRKEDAVHDVLQRYLNKGILFIPLNLDKGKNE